MGALHGPHSFPQGSEVNGPKWLDGEEELLDGPGPPSFKLAPNGKFTSVPLKSPLFWLSDTHHPDRVLPTQNTFLFRRLLRSSCLGVILEC